MSGLPSKAIATPFAVSRSYPGPMCNPATGEATNRYDLHAIDLAMDRMSGIEADGISRQSAYEKWKTSLNEGRTETHPYGREGELADGTIKLYYRHRLTGLPIKGEPGALAFQASYEEAGKAHSAKQTETFSTLIVDFLNRRNFGLGFRGHRT